MTPGSHILILISSVLCCLAVMLGVRWVGPAWDKLSRKYVGDIIVRLRALGMDDRAVDGYLRWWGILLFLTLFVIGVAMGMFPVAVGITYLVFIAPRFLLDLQVARRRILLRDQMVRATVALANSARAGLSLVQGLEILGKETPPPLSAEFRRVVSEYHAGRPLADALREVQRRLDLEAFSLFAAAVIVCMERGGRVTFALERISSGLQDLQRLERKLEADSASGRKVATILGMFPLFFLVGFTLLDPVSMGFLYNTLLGQFVLLGVGVMVYLSARWCLWILRIDF